jgi:hypothetical protein
MEFKKTFVNSFLPLVKVVEPVFTSTTTMQTAHYQQQLPRGLFQITKYAIIHLRIVLILKANS